MVSKNFEPNLNVTDVLVMVAEFQESIKPAIPQILDFLIQSQLNDHRVGMDALSKFSEQGKS